MTGIIIFCVVCYLLCGSYTLVISLEGCSPKITVMDAVFCIIIWPLVLLLALVGEL